MAVSSTQLKERSIAPSPVGNLSSFEDLQKVTNRDAGVLRISEVLGIRMRDVSIFHFTKVFLIMRKNDQYRDGHVSVIDYWSRKHTCPAGITERISSLLPDSSSSSYPIVCRIVNSRHSKKRFHKSLV